VEKKAPLEKELKYTLTRSEYAKLRLALKNDCQRPVRSESYYFEDEALTLRRSGIGCRIRLLQGGSASLTVKLPSRSRGTLRAYRVRRELESTLPLRSARDLVKGKRKLATLRVAPLRALVGATSPELPARLRVIGGMKMARVKARYEGLPLEIDRFRIFGELHYELEIETEDARGADRKVRSLFRRLSIRYRPSTLSKLGRFFAAWESRR
jgi:uncharacterized protein YjbK